MQLQADHRRREGGWGVGEPEKDDSAAVGGRD
jgi:hypothetical protein